MDWGIQIAVSSGSITDRISWIGISNGVQQQGTKQNLHKPSGFSTAPQVIFNRPEWDNAYSSFATDVRPEFDKMEKWEFDVLSSVKTPLTLSFNGMIDVPSQFQVYLIDRIRGTVTDLRKGAAYKFSPDRRTSKFEIVIGETDITQEYLSTVTRPHQFSLGKNYPNPFNPSTSIPVEIPLNSKISLKIFNILGQEVRSLHEGNIDAGFYSFDWNGRDNAGKSMPSGVYFCRLQSPVGVVSTQKMLMVK
jgi:hypothetical protein